VKANGKTPISGKNAYFFENFKIGLLSCKKNVVPTAQVHGRRQWIFILGTDRQREA